MMKRILLADDDADDRLLFEEVLTELLENFQLHCAINGEDAMRVLSGMHDAVEYPDLIVLDQNMPLLNGKDTLVAIRKIDRFQHIPIILYSTYNDKDFIEDSLRLGALDVTSKPDSYEGFVDMIGSFLKKI